MLFCPCVVWKATADVGTKALNIRHQAQKVFRGIFVGIPQYQKVFILYVPSTKKIISSCDVVLYESFSIVLACMSQPYSESMAMPPAVLYTPCATSLREQTGDVITSAQFEEGNILTETRNNAESGDKFNDDSIMPTLLSKEEIVAIDSGNESHNNIISFLSFFLSFGPASNVPKLTHYGVV